MMISDPPLIIDLDKIGQKVNFNHNKQESLDGFIKAGQQCFCILPPVYKLTAHTNNNQNNQAAKNSTDEQAKELLKKGQQKNPDGYDFNVTSIIGNIKHLEISQKLEQSNGTTESSKDIQKD